MGNYKNCSRCSCFKSKFGLCPEGYIFISDDPNSCLGPMYGICEAGLNEEMKAWWLKNGNLKPEDCENIPCYKATELDEKMDNLLSSLDRLIKK